jgi:hypothetical protein
MAIIDRSKMPNQDKIIIDLSGPDGNSFILMGIAKNLAKQLGLDGDMIVKEMMLGDYENLLEVMEEYFGEFIIMYR